MTSDRVKLTFPPDLVREPIMGELVRRFDVLPNIRRADVRDEVGWIVCEMSGTQEALVEALDWLEDLGVEVDRLDQPLEG
ncbi:MAG TPA: NIL domain-containing protein [Acidimicrobiales bacterium]|nr:NIL domain-containing protein [Acidimicrobiales bacterium]